MNKNIDLYNEIVKEEKNKLEASFNIFRNLCDKASTRSKVDIEARNEYRPTFLKALESMARLLNAYYEGQGAILEATGFEILKGPISRSIGQIKEIVTKNGAVRGEVNVRVTGAVNTHSLLVEYTTEDYSASETKWTYQVYTTKSFTLKGFKFGDKVCIRVRAYGKDNTYTKTKTTLWASN